MNNLSPIIPQYNFLSLNVNAKLLAACGCTFIRFGHILCTRLMRNHVQDRQTCEPQATYNLVFILKEVIIFWNYECLVIPLYQHNAYQNASH